MVKLEADFQSEYRLDLRALLRKGSYRRIISLMLELPRTARLWAYIVGDLAQWGGQEHILADIRDISRTTAYFSMVAAGGGMKRSTWDKVVRDIPKPLPRPGDPPPKVEMSSDEDLADFFGMPGKPHGRKK